MHANFNHKAAYHSVPHVALCSYMLHCDHDAKTPVAYGYITSGFIYVPKFEFVIHHISYNKSGCPSLLSTNFHCKRYTVVTGCCILIKRGHLFSCMKNCCLKNVNLNITNCY